MGFQAPRLGALGLTFLVMRALQFAALIAVIGLSANFIDEFSTKSLGSPSELLGTLVVAVIAVIYVVISYVLYYDAMLPYLLSGILDGLLLIAFIVVASLLGKPLSHLQCALMPQDPDANNFWTSVPFTIKSQETTHDDGLYFTFVHMDQPTCFETKAIWGLSIALCVLFAFSSIVCVGLWRRVSRETVVVGSRKDIEESDVSLYGHKTTTTAPPQFPPPPLAPMRITGGARRSDNQQQHDSNLQDIPVPNIRARAGLPQNRRSLSGSRSSIDSDASSTLSRGASPERQLRISGGLAPPPPVRHCCNGGRVGLGIMPTIPGSPIDAIQERTIIDGISPIMSRAPQALPLPVADPAFRSTSTNNLTLAVPSATHGTYSHHNHGQVGAGRATLHPPLTIITEFPIVSPSGYWPTNNISPQEYKRAAPPRSPLSPLSLRGLGSFMARRGCKRKEVPPPIIVHPSSPSQFAHVVNSAGTDSVALGTPVDGLGPSQSPPPPHLQMPNPPKKRKTVWGMMVEGWWDLGLLERMGSGKRKNMK
ncbi:hypothetical protein NEUTE1DRAFT_123780 [Neurospora tetrasperma FGSC 2508]|uniref:Uncharacterized protein n=1 Tax=Neurospora tetrasperma (strain FGSC 2508 / ATCC MYA-4615 / P0657) TaxID=510951 RepID=F8MTK5_NEUT8|nr:uncharacterized protein NEUTE1DRAFT_123780 [Neurospora tetrasperma FGSC 2508]EGO55337.1 hypothetical protein NEUTE1DRAFT_123780 [Neurospora tetrasperma FGSC 2508]